MKMEFSTVPFEEGLKDRLKDREYAIAYLKACVGKSPSTLLLAIRDVAEAHGMSKIAKEAHVTRGALYKMLSKEGNPTLRILMSLLQSLGVVLDFAPAPRKKSERAVRSRERQAAGG